MLRPITSEPTELTIFNPDTEDFTITYDDDNGPKPYTIYRLSLGTFPYNIAKHITKHLAHKIYFKRGNKVNYDDDIIEITKEIEVQL